MTLPQAHADLLLALAREAYAQSGPTARVAEWLSAYVESFPEDGLAWFQYGDSLRVLGRYHDAERALLRARDMAPEARRFVVDARLGMLFSKSGARAEAEKWFRLATSDGDSAGWMWCLRGANLLHMESIDAAKECLRTALGCKDVDREEVLLNLGLAARAVGEYDEAARLANEALDVDPSYQPARELLDSVQGAEHAREQVEAIKLE
jgi:tetratricopeptide (TPR) repeat protein